MVTPIPSHIKDMIIPSHTQHDHIVAHSTWSRTYHPTHIHAQHMITPSHTAHGKPILSHTQHMIIPSYIQHMITP